MMVDVSDMCHIWLEVRNHALQAPPGIGRIDRMGCQAGTLRQSLSRIFEVEVGNVMHVVRRRFGARIRHREQGDIVPTRSQKVDQLEQVHFGATKRETVFIAKQDLHLHWLQLASESAGVCWVNPPPDGSSDRKMPTG